MVQHRPLFCDMVFQNNSLSFEPRKLATHISQCLGRSSLVPLVSDQSRCGISNSLLDRSLNRWRVDGASDYQCSIPAEKEQEVQPKQ